MFDLFNSTLTFINGLFQQQLAADNFLGAVNKLIHISQQSIGGL